MNTLKRMAHASLALVALAGAAACSVEGHPAAQPVPAPVGATAEIGKTAETGGTIVAGKAGRAGEAGKAGKGGKAGSGDVSPPAGGAAGKAAPRKEPLGIADITPMDEKTETVGVGFPIIVTFDKPVANRAAAEAVLQVQADRPVEGAWRWVSDRKVVYRTKTFWRPHQKVLLTARLSQIPGNEATKDVTRRFAVGTANVSVVIGAPLLARLVEGSGWRAGYIALSLAVLFIALPVAWGWLHEPQAKRAGETAALASAGMTYRDALRSLRFWLLALSTAGVAFSMGGIIPNLQPLLMDRGLAATQAAAYLGVMGLSVILGRLASGFLLDRFWAPAVATLFLSVPAAACWLFTQPELGSVALVTAVALVGLAAGAEFDLLAYLCARYFGLRHYSQIYGTQWVAFTLFAGIGPPVFGYASDVTHSYASILYVACAIFLVAPALLLTLGKYPIFAASEPSRASSTQHAEVEVRPPGEGGKALDLMKRRAAAALTAPARPRR